MLGCFVKASLRTYHRVGGNEDLKFGIGEDHSANIAAVHHEALVVTHLLLLTHHVVAHKSDGCDDAHLIPSFLEDFRWQLVRDFLMEKYGLQVTREDVQKAAEGYVAYQYAMYGIGNVPEQMIKEAADRILSEGKQTGMLQEQVENNKVLDALKADITIKPKKIALSKFKELK